MSDEAASPEAVRLNAEADATIERYKSYLTSPAFEHSVDLMVLVKIAGDENADIRERRRAAEVLAKLRLQAMEGLADIVAARDQTLDRLGIKTGPAAALSMTQVNNRIEIVRAEDWRVAAPLEQGAEIEVLPAPSSPSSNGHESNGHAGQEKRDGADPLT